MKIYKDQLYWFALLYIIFIPTGWYLFSSHEFFTQAVTGKLTSFIAEKIFDKPLARPEISSDSLSTYILLLLFIVLSFVIALLTQFSKSFQKKKEAFFSFCRIIFNFYLASQLFIYGFDKIFKGQFYLPEPNTLYTPLGFMSRDILYWSTMGSSYEYNLFLGTLEVLTALLLVFRKTRAAGSIGALILLLNIMAVNFSFDISVKIHSSFLFFLSLLLVFPSIKPIYAFFIQKKPVQLNEQKQPFSLSLPLYTTVKVFVLCIMLFEAIIPYIKTKNFSDDYASRPFLHGAYEVQPEAGEGTLPVKRFFIHRDGYFIFQNNRDEMKDYKLFVDSITGYFRLVDYNLHQTRLRYQYSDSLLTLQFFYNNKEYLLKGRSLPWKNLPLLKKDFHWTVEGVSGE